MFNGKEIGYLSGGAVSCVVRLLLTANYWLNGVHRTCQRVTRYDDHIVCSSISRVDVKEELGEELILGNQGCLGGRRLHNNEKAGMAVGERLRMHKINLYRGGIFKRSPR